MNEVRLSQTQFMDEVRLTQAQQASTQIQQASQIVSLGTKLDVVSSDVSNKFDILLAAIQRQPQSFPYGHGASSGND